MWDNKSTIRLLKFIVITLLIEAVATLHYMSLWW